MQVSRCNPGEVRIIAAHVAALVEAGVSPDAIGVITPYNLQVRGTCRWVLK
jgi:superfamily I DNA and/or RNA helicase